MEDELQFESIEDYQKYLKQRQELMAYCKKISQGIDNLDEKIGERAIWELVQNARDMDENCRIRIKLMPDRIVFSHHGKPFGYTSLLALVNQNSSKDNPGADLVGQYGTGFMTTHAFNDIVSVTAPYKAMSKPNVLKGYVHMDIELNRSYRNNLERAIKEMGDEMQLVDDMHKRTPLYPTFEEMSDDMKWTTFTYMLDTAVVESVSKQLSSVARLMPFVLVINDRIKDVEVEDLYAQHHYRIVKTSNAAKTEFEENSTWRKVTDVVETTDLNTQTKSTCNVTSLQSVNADGKVDDVIILPPYPATCGEVNTIPSLFLWFPLLGTENFGVNFIFHSKRWHPVEKRNNIMLPENVSSKREKGAHNEMVLREMMSALHRYMAIDGNCADLTREMCMANFHCDSEDEVTAKFYDDLQSMWKAVMPTWKVIPTTDGKKAMSDVRVKLLHPDFYSKLTDEKKTQYETTLSDYAKSVKYSESENYLIPTSELIAWSVLVDQWRCNRDGEFFISVDDVCKSVKSKTDKLHEFLSFLVDSENAALLDKYELLPNRKGNLRKKGDLRHGDFMTSQLYTLTELLMGSDSDKMIDTTYNGLANAVAYKPEDLQRSIGQTVGQWRNYALGTTKNPLSDDQLNALINFCSATSQQEFNNYRGRMMAHIVKVYGKTLVQKLQPKVIEKEDDFYNPAFNLLLDYTLYTISTKDAAWVKENEPLLKDFLTEYATSAATDRLSKLDDFAVIPNQNHALCLKKNLFKNVNVNDQLAKFYLDVMKEDLREHWVHDTFSSIFTYNEEKAAEVANKIQTKLSDDDFQDTVLLDIIELAENETIDSWKILFKTIYAQRESIRYNLGSDAERKAINRMMKKKDPALLELMADVAERDDAHDVIGNVQQVINDMEHDAHIKMLGAYVERHLLEYLTTALECADVKVDNQQGGQDFILSKPGKDNYHIEIKSRWESDQSVEMTAEQCRCAVDNPDRYALISVNMYHYSQDLAKDNVRMELKDIYDKIKCLDNIGLLEADLRKRAVEAFKGGDSEIRLNGSYKVRVPQDVFDAYPLDFDGLVVRIKKYFSKE